MEMADATWTTIRAEAVVAVPVGATEQHGPHLPLDTDTRIAVALARALSDARPGVMVAPALAYGSSGEHQAFPGTLSIGGPTLEGVLLELGRSSAHPLVFVHGHGGNAAPANAAVDRLHQEGRRVLSWFPRTHHDSHAGHDETSIMLHLAPDLVRIDQVAPGNTAPLRELMPELRAHGLREVSDSGVLGDPTTATAAAGDKIWHDLVDQLLRAYDDWRLDAT